MTEEYPIEFMQWAAAQCYCCPECSDHPCPGVMAGGLCDGIACTCDHWLSECDDWLSDGLEDDD